MLLLETVQLLMIRSSINVMWMISVLLKSENHVNPLLRRLNSKHPNIKFTCEIEKDKFLVFLNINFHRSSNSFETSVHRISTFSGVYTGYRSFVPTH